MSTRRRLGQLVAYGKPVTKKTSGRVVYKGCPKGYGPGLARLLRGLASLLERRGYAEAQRVLAAALGGRGGGGVRPIVLPSAAYTKWEAEVVPQMRTAWTARPAAGGPEQHLHIVALIYVARFGRRQLGGDLAGFYQAIGDALEVAGVITNDAFIRSWAGSCVRKDAADPRVEITIYEMLVQGSGQAVLGLGGAS
jgi:hypothetical protein